MTLLACLQTRLSLRRRILEQDSSFVQPVVVVQQSVFRVNQYLLNCEENRRSEERELERLREVTEAKLERIIARAKSYDSQILVRISRERAQSTLRRWEEEQALNPNSERASHLLTTAKAAQRNYERLMLKDKKVSGPFIQSRNV